MSTPTDSHPDDRKQVMHQFECGHTARSTRRNVRLHPDRCSACRLADWEARAPERRRQRRRELAAEAEKYGPRPAATPAQRDAQRVIVALVQPRSGRMLLDPDTRELLFVERRDGTGASLHEVGKHLEALGVPFRPVVKKRTKGRRRIVEVRLAVKPEDREALLRWVPSLGPKLARTEAKIPTPGST